MDLFDLVAKITLDSSEYDKGLKGAGEKASSFSKAGAAMWGVWSEVGRKAISGVFSVLNSNMGGAVKRLDTLNNFPKVMQSLGFSAEEARAGIDNLANNIDHLPTTLDAVASQAQQFVPMTKNIEEATNITLALNNAMAAGGKDAESQQRAIEAWTKSMAKGKPEFEAWNSMVQTAPAQMDQLAQAMLGAGKGQNDLYEAMKNGSVSIDEVNDKMIELTNATDGFDIAGVHYDNFAKQAENASAGIQMSMTNVKAAVQRNLANVMDSFNTATESIGGIPGIISSVIPAINSLGETFTGMLTGDISFEDGMTSLMESLQQGALDLVYKGGDLVGSLIEGITQAIPSLMETATTIGESVINAIGTKGGELLPKGVELVFKLVEGIGIALPNLITAGLNAITNLINGLTSGDSKLGAKAVSMALKIAKAFIKAAPQMVVAGLRLISALIQGIARMGAQAVSKSASVASKIPKAIKKGLGNLASAGRDLIAGLWNGIKSKFDSTIEKVKALAAKLPKAVKKVLGISSPSKVFAEIGKWIPEGLSLGITRNLRTVEEAADAMSNATLVSGTGSDYTSTGLGKMAGEVLQIELEALAPYISESIAEAMEGITVTLDRRTFGKMTRKAAGGVL